MTFPKYPEYKDSGVEWLGEVPAHWDVERLKHSVDSCRNGIWGEEPAGDSGDLPCVRVADFDRPRLRVVLENPTLRSVKPSERKGRVLKRGDLVLEKSGGGEKQPVGFVVLYDDDRPAVCSNFTAKMELSEGMNPSFWRYVHAAAYSIRLNVPSIKQTSGIQNLDQQSYLDERAPYPPSSEQTHIASFLDQETARIGALVEEQQRLIELLKEKRQAVISHAVTKGLDPDAPMKDSGVEWLGEVPAHWDILRIGSIYVEAAEKGLAELPVLRVSIHHGVSDRELNEEESDRKITRIEDREKYKRVRHGDLVYNMMRAWQGGFGAVLVDGLVSPAYVVARPKSHDVSEFIEQLLRTPSAIEEMRSRSYGITDFRLRLYWDQFKNIKIALPPREERQEIANRLQEIIAESTALETEAGINISLLEERRSALISAAVTGKIDVRDWQPPAGSSAPAEISQTEAV